MQSRPKQSPENFRLLSLLKEQLAVSKAEGLLLAVSGGSDSMALMEMTAALGPGDRPCALSVAAVNHGFREGAGEECRLVAQRAAELELDCQVLHCAPEGEDESALREARYAALRRYAAAKGLGWIATAHTRDDQIETILFRLARGSGLHGMSGIAAQNGNLLRPLLSVSGAELRAYLLSNGCTWCEDPTNDSDRYTRNRIRSLVIPAFHEALGAKALDRIPAMAERWRLDESYLEAETERFLLWCERGDSQALDLAALRECPQSLRGRILRKWYKRQGGSPTLGMRELQALEDFVGLDRPATQRLGNLELKRNAFRVEANRPKQPKT